MRRARWAIFFTLAFVNSAEAAHCPAGQIWRIRLGECLSRNDARARAYVSLGDSTKPWRFEHVAPGHTYIPPTVPIVPLIPIIPPIEHDRTPFPIDDTDGPIVTDKPMPMPELQAGMPLSWRICVEHHEWCEQKGTPSK
jgi:hypothetical protein